MRALDAGADDYVTKPFSQEGFWRECVPKCAEPLPVLPIKRTIFGLRISRSAAHRAYVYGVDMHLTHKSLRYLGNCEKSEAVITYETYWREFWGPEYEIQPLFTHLPGRVRKKLGAEMELLLETVSGVGYILHSDLTSDFHSD